MEALEAKEVALSDEVTGAGDERGAPGWRHALCSPRSCLGRHPPFQPVPLYYHWIPNSKEMKPVKWRGKSKS